MIDVALDAAALEACHRRVEKGLFNVLLRMLWDMPACQDVMQEAFLKLWAQRMRLEADNIDALAYATAMNLARNRLRWQRLRQWVGLEAMEGSAMGMTDGIDTDLLTLRAGLAELDAGDRELLLLSEYAGMDTAELATLLRIAPGTVGSRKHRAMQRLREVLKDQDHANESK